MLWIVNNLYELDDVRVCHLLHDGNLLLYLTELSRLGSEHSPLQLGLVDDLHRIHLLRVSLDDTLHLREVSLAHLTENDIVIDLLAATLLLLHDGLGLHRVLAEQCDRAGLDRLLGFGAVSARAVHAAPL